MKFNLKAEEARAKWAEALESDEFKQTCGVLKRIKPRGDPARYGVGHCCLGVVTELFQKYEPQFKLLSKEVNGVIQYRLGDDEAASGHSTWNDGTLAPIVADWLGLSIANTYGNECMSLPRRLCTDRGSEGAPENYICSLTDLNDSLGRTFKQIAEVVRFIGTKPDEYHLRVDGEAGPRDYEVYHPGILTDPPKAD